MTDEHVHVAERYKNETKTAGTNDNGVIWHQLTWGVCACGYEFGKIKTDEWVS